ncbi:MAG: hypothetical protein AB7N76_07630 [Planctomycetota bacterium]
MLARPRSLWLAPLPLFLAPFLAALPALAQEQPGGSPAPATHTPSPRVEVSCEAKLDDAVIKPNGLQYFMYERFNTFRFRVDSKAPIGAKAFDKFVAKMDRFWAKQDPQNQDPVHFKLTVKQETKYDAAKFYGEAQAHNFKGTLNATLTRADGTKVMELSLPLSWGRLISSGLSKSQVQGRYDQMLHTAAAMGLLNHPEVLAKIPAKHRAALAKWTKEQKADLLKVLEGSTDLLKKGPLAEFVRGIKVEGEEGKDGGAKDGAKDGGKEASAPGK